MSFTETIRLAFSNVRNNVLRSVMTLMIIAFGIMALVGILTAIDAILFSMSDNFSSLGANSFAIQRTRSVIKSNRGGRQVKQGPIFTYKQGVEFKDRFDFPGVVSISMPSTNTATVKYEKEKSNPTVSVRGIDDGYFYITSSEIEKGRNFSKTELEYGSQKAILGSAIIDMLFDNKPEQSLGKTISIGSHKFKVIGTIASKGSSMSSSSDKRVYIPLTVAKKLYGTDQSNYYIDVAVNNTTQMEDAIAYSTGLMRNVRKLRASEENDFRIRKSDGILAILKDVTFELRLATIAIALMTLFGAAIGLMNIMLVSVTERTKEIGVIKALGATQKNIITQFLSEAVIISLLGGLTGILLGILVGNIVTLLVGGSFLIPWAWITLGLIICTVVGLLSGLYPALKASRLDPIEALRYE